MSARTRPLGPAFVTLLAGMTVLLASFHGHTAADAPAVTVRRSQPGAPCPHARPPQTRAESFSETDDPPTPMVSLHVRVLAEGAIGQELAYRLLVENRSRAPAHHVLVRNPIPDHARFVRAAPEPSAKDPELIWKVGTLEPGASKEIVLVLSPTGAGDVTNCARVQFEHGQCTTTMIARPGLSLRMAAPTQALVGDTLNYQLTVTNIGAADAADVLLTDTLPAGLVHATGRNTLTWEVGKLLAGQSAVIDYQLIAKAAGKLCNHVVATAAGGLREEQETCVTVAEPKLAMIMTGPTERILTLAASYQITVTNPGTAPVQDVVVQNAIPAQAAFVSASGGGNLTEGQVVWSLGVLQPGASRTFEIELRAEAKGRLCNRATATGARGLTAQAEFCTDFTGEAGVLLEVIDTEDPVEVGGTTRYQITVRNQGQIPVTNVVIQATVPLQLTVLRASGPADNRQDGARILYEPLTIQPGKEVRYEIEVKAVQPGDVRFKVELTADQLRVGGPVHEEESTTIYRDLPASLRKGRRP